MNDEKDHQSKFRCHCHPPFPAPPSTNENVGRIRPVLNSTLKRVGRGLTARVPVRVKICPPRERSHGSFHREQTWSARAARDSIGPLCLALPIGATLPAPFN